MKNIVQLKNMNNKVYIKFVEKAGAWCKTYWNEKNEQLQEWSSERPSN